MEHHHRRACAHSPRVSSPAKPPSARIPPSLPANTLFQELWDKTYQYSQVCILLFSILATPLQISKRGFEAFLIFFEHLRGALANIFIFPMMTSRNSAKRAATLAAALIACVFLLESGAGTFFPEARSALAWRSSSRAEGVAPGPTTPAFPDL